MFGRRTRLAALLRQDGLQAGVHILGHGGTVAAHIHTGALPAGGDKESGQNRQNSGVSFGWLTCEQSLTSQLPT